MKKRNLFLIIGTLALSMACVFCTKSTTKTTTPVLAGLYGITDLTNTTIEWDPEKINRYMMQRPGDNEWYFTSDSTYPDLEQNEQIIGLQTEIDGLDFYIYLLTDNTTYQIYTKYHDDETYYFDDNYEYLHITGGIDVRNPQFLNFVDRTSSEVIRDSTDNQELYDQIRNLQQQITFLQDEIYEYKQTNANNKETIKNLTYQITSLQNTITSLNNHIDTKNQDIADLNYQIEILTSAIDSQTGEVIDIGGLMYQTVSMPFDFVRHGFNLTLFPNTFYEINVANILIGLFSVAVLFFFIKIIKKVI